MKRFSKKATLQYLERKINYMQKAYGFHDGTGWKQVEDKPIEIVVEYGRWIALQEMERDILEGYI